MTEVSGDCRGDRVGAAREPGRSWSRGHQAHRDAGEDRARLRRLRDLRGNRYCPRTGRSAGRKGNQRGARTDGVSGVDSQ